MSVEYVLLVQSSGLQYRGELMSSANHRPPMLLGATVFYPSLRQARQMAKVVFKRTWDKNGRVTK